jgi:hypothetical protein
MVRRVRGDLPVRARLPRLRRRDSVRPDINVDINVDIIIDERASGRVRRCLVRNHRGSRRGVGEFSDVRRDVALAADAEMPHHGHGMNLVPVVKPAPGRGRFIAEGMLLHMPGRWIVAIDVEESGVAERAHWIIDVE